MNTHFGSTEMPVFHPAANDEPAGPSARPRLAGARVLNEGPSRFTIYRAESVSHTSTLSGGGDWHWRLTSPEGAILVDCGGYRDHAHCLAAVEALRGEAARATILDET